MPRAASHTSSTHQRGGGETAGSVFFQVEPSHSHVLGSTLPAAPPNITMRSATGSYPIAARARPTVGLSGVDSLVHVPLHSHVSALQLFGFVQPPYIKIPARFEAIA